MKKKYRTTLCRKSLAIAMALMVGVTFMPAFGGVYAAEDEAGGAPAKVATDQAGAEVQDQDIQIEIPEETPDADAETEDITGTEDVVVDDAEEIQVPASNKKGAGALQPLAVTSGYGITCKVTVNSGAGTARVKATAASGDVIYGIGVDGDLALSFTDNPQKTVDKTVSLKGDGYHSVGIITKKSYADEKLAFLETDIPVFTEKPTYKGSFEVFSKYLNYYPYTITYANASHPLYLEYSVNGGKTWKRSGYMKRNDIELGLSQGFKIGGLKGNKKYKTRIRYGDSFKKADGSYGTIFGPVFYTGTYKTGKAKKPAVKSVTVKAVKKKYHKVKHYGPYTGVYLYTEKFWTCKIKVTVKLKKKPGTKGIWVNGKFLKGNKKKYTTTFSPYPNYFTKRPPRGMKKYTVSIRSYQAKSYGGYSPVYKKKKKIR